MGSTPKGISASRGAAVLGLSEFQTPFEVFQRIMEECEPGWNAAHGYALPPEPDSAAIRWGTAFEDAVVELAERKQGREIVSREVFFSLNEKSCGNEFYYVTCHIDGQYKYDGSTVLHEGKTTSAMAFREKWGEPGTDHIPQIYQVQVQHQMLCTGAEEAIVSVLVFPETPDKWEAMGWVVLKSDGEIMQFNEDGIYKKSRQISKWASVLADMGYFHQYPVRANLEAQRKIAEAYREFWDRHVLTGVPPEPRNYDDIKRLCPEPKSTIIVPDYISRKIEEYKGITEEASRSTKRKERLKTIITGYAATHTGIEDDESKEAVIFRSAHGEKLASWSRVKSRALTFRCSGSKEDKA